jgi:ABC-2 type transport system ATP-binding protein
MIKFKSVTRKYDDLIAVDSVSFQIGNGEIVGLLGHNGAGKTTIMKMLTGFIEPTSGDIEVDGVNVEADRLAAQRKIGYLPENSPIYPDMLVAQYLEYVCELRDIAGAQRTERIKEVVKQTALAEKITQPINTLSKGYKQRVGVAQAIIHKPEILILDEPTNGLDPEQIHEMRSLVTNLAKSATVILSTHILQEVQAICSRVLIMSHGKLAKDSRLQDLQESNRVILSVAGAESDIKSALNNLSEITGMEFIGNGGPAKRFAIQLGNNSEEQLPIIAEKVIKSGLKLYGLEPEARNLETVFREISSQGGRDVK